MKDCKDSHGFGLKIASLELKFYNLTSKEDKMATLIGATGARYATSICGEKKMFESKEEEITFRALLEAIRDVWRLLTKNSSAGRNDDEKALGPVQPDAFARNCFKCGSADTGVSNAQLTGHLLPVARNMRTKIVVSLDILLKAAGNIPRIWGRGP